MLWVLFKVICLTLLLVVAIAFCVQFFDSEFALASIRSAGHSDFNFDRFFYSYGSRRSNFQSIQNSVITQKLASSYVANDRLQNAQFRVRYRADKSSINGRQVPNLNNISRVGRRVNHKPTRPAQNDQDRQRLVQSIPFENRFRQLRDDQRQKEGDLQCLSVNDGVDPREFEKGFDEELSRIDILKPNFFDLKVSKQKCSRGQTLIFNDSEENIKYRKDLRRLFGRHPERIKKEIQQLKNDLLSSQQARSVQKSEVFSVDDEALALLQIIDRK